MRQRGVGWRRAEPAHNLGRCPQVRGVPDMLSADGLLTERATSGARVSGAPDLEHEEHSTADHAEPTSDTLLYQRFRKHGDVDAFGELFARHRDALLRFLWTLCASQATAEDLSQYCWLKLMEGGYRKQPGATIRSYLYTIGRNRYVDEHVRKHEASRSQSLDDSMIADPQSPDPAAGAADIQTQGIVVTAMLALPLAQREVLSMWIEGFSLAEMMAATGAARDTVLSRKKYAMQKTRHVLESAGVRSGDG